MTSPASRVHSTPPVIDPIIEEEARQGNPKRQYELGKRYKNGEGVERSYEKAFYWLGKAGDTYLSNGKFQKAFDCYQIEKDIWLNELVVKGEHPSLETCYKKIERVWKLGHLDNPLDISFLYDEIGVELLEQGHFKHALEYFDKALDVRKKVYGSKDCLEIAASLNYKGRVLLLLEYAEGALEYFQIALAMQERTLGLRDHPNIANSLSDIGFALSCLGRYDEALMHYQRCLKMKNAIYDLKPHPEIAFTLDCIGHTFRKLGDFDKALEYHEQSLEMRKEIYGSTNHAEIVESLHNIGNILCTQNKFQKAHKYFRESLEMNQKIYGSEDGVAIANSLFHMAEVLERLGSFEEADKYYQRFHEMYERGCTHVIWEMMGPYLSKVSKCLGRLGKFRKALEIAEKTFAHNRSFYPETHPYVADSLLDISTCLYSLGDYSTSAKRCEEGYTIYKTRYGDDHPRIADFFNNKGKCLEASEKIDEALENYRKALDIHTRYGNQHLRVATDWRSIGIGLLKKRDFKAAIESFEKGLAITKEILGEKHPNTVEILTFIDTCYKALSGPQTEPVQEEDQLEGILNKAHFQELVRHALSYLNNAADNVRVEKNPSGFVRLHLPIPPEFALADKIKELRLNYWPREELEIDTVEAPHDHPRRFESMILNEGYTHTLYRQNSNAPSAPFRMHRVVKSPNPLQNLEERNMTYLWTVNLECLGEQTTQRDSIVVFPTSLIHQVSTFKPETLSINAVFKSLKILNYFNVYAPKDDRNDPKRERDYLDLDKAEQVVSEIRILLAKYTGQNLLDPPRTTKTSGEVATDKEEQIELSSTATTSINKNEPKEETNEPFLNWDSHKIARLLWENGKTPISDELSSNKNKSKEEINE